MADLAVVDLDTFLTGKIDVTHKPKVVGVSLLTGKTESLTYPEFVLLSTLNSNTWVSQREILTKFEVAQSQLNKLAEHGFILSDGDDSLAAELRLRDSRIDKLHWNPYQAFAYMRNRWLDAGPDAQAPSDLMGYLDDYRQLINVYGNPPAHFHEVSSKRRVELPQTIQNEGIFKTLLARQTARYFSTDKQLPAADLSCLLMYTFGYHGTYTLTDGYTVLKKTSPSGGSLHPIEAYPLILNVEGVESGLYHYNIRDHCLDLVKELTTFEGRALAKQMTAAQEYFHSANVLVVLTGRFDRNFWKYRNHQKALKVVEMDAAHLSQTFYLIGTELGLGTFTTAAIVDDIIEESLDLPIFVEGAMMIVGCGYPINEETPGGFDFNPRAR